MRNRALDILRILACLMIVTMHAPMPTGEENGIFLASLSYLTAPGIGLFFMLSGALLLPMKTGVKTFLKNRFVKIAVPTVLWTCIYLVLNAYLHGKPISWQVVFSIPFSAQGNQAFWFLYTLMGLYLIVPILSRWVQKASCRELELYLVLWAVSLCYPLLQSVLDINLSPTGILYYLSGYVGYFVLGYYLKIYPDRIPFKWLLPFVIVAIVAPVYCKVKRIPVDFYSVFWYLSILVAILCVFIWRLVILLIPKREAGRGSSPLVAHVSQLSFGVYLTHYFIIREILWRIESIRRIPSYILQTTTIILLAILASFMVSGIIACLPGSRFLIGTSLFRKHE